MVYKVVFRLERSTRELLTSLFAREGRKIGLHFVFAEVRFRGN